MTYNEIIRNFPEQVQSHKPFIIEMIEKGTLNKSYTLRIAQNIQGTAEEILNNAYPKIQTCYHFNVKQDMVDSLNLQKGTILENFNISVWDSSDPMYSSQKPRMFTEGPFAGELMLHLGIPYYRHTKLVVGVPRLDIWVPDQIKNAGISIKQPPQQEKSDDFDSITVPNLDVDIPFDL